MGHTINTYEDVQSLGIETLRNLYAAAGLAIRPKTQVNRIEQLKEIIRAWVGNQKKSYLKTLYLEATSPKDKTKRRTISSRFLQKI